MPKVCAVWACDRWTFLPSGLLANHISQFSMSQNIRGQCLKSQIQMNSKMKLADIDGFFCCFMPLAWPEQLVLWGDPIMRGDLIMRIHKDSKNSLQPQIDLLNVLSLSGTQTITKAKLSSKTVFPPIITILLSHKHLALKFSALLVTRSCLAQRDRLCILYQVSQPSLKLSLKLLQTPLTI